MPESLDGARLDKALAQLVPELSRARVRRAIELGAVRVNGRRLPKGGVLARGDTVRIDVAQVADAPAVATPDAPIKIVLETDQVVVVDKPAGQPTAPIRPGETGTLVNALLGRYPELVPQDAETFVGHSARDPGILHRLDTETSGAVVVARTAQAFDELKHALKDGKLDKRYLLVCASEGLPDEGTIEFPLTDHPKDQRRVYPCVHPRDVMRYEPRPAATRFQVVQRAGNWALVEARVRQGAPSPDPRALRGHRAPARRRRAVRRPCHPSARAARAPRGARDVAGEPRGARVRRRGPAAQGHGRAHRGRRRS